MKKNILLFAFLTSIISVAQEKKIQLGFQLFSNFSTGIPSKGSENYAYYKGIETFVFSYSAGMQFDFNISDKWTFASGILLTKSGDRSKIFPADTSRGFFFTRYYTFRMFYLELPLLLARNIGEHLRLEIGISPMFNLVGQRRINYGSNTAFGSIKPSTNIIGLNTNFGFGYQTKFGTKNLIILPYVQYNVLDGIYEIGWIDYSPTRKYIAGGLKITVLF